MSYNFKSHNDRNVIVTLKQHAMWIKQIEQRIDAIIKGGISIKLPFTFNKDGTVVWTNEGSITFNQNIAINNEEGNIDNLYQYLKDLHNEITEIREIVESISDINNIESIIKQLTNINNEIDVITDHLVGFTRKSEDSKTIVNDELEISKQLTISATEVINASIVGYSGDVSINFNTDGFNGVLCVGNCIIDGKRVSKQNYYTNGTNVNFKPEMLYLISLVGGKIVGNECRFDKINTDLSIINKNSSNETLFEINLDISSGSCVIDSTGAKFAFNLGSNSKLVRPTYTFEEEIEGTTYTFDVLPSTYTLHGTDNTLKFTSSEITFDDVNKEIKTVGDVKIVINDSDNSFNVFNSDSIITGETSVSFNSGSYLNGYKETSAIVPVELVNTFKEVHNIEGDISYGVNVQNKSSDGVGIVFKGSDGDVNLTYKSIRTDPDDVSKVKRVLYIDSDVKIKYGDADSDVITFSELYGILLNRIITLERKADFTYSTNLTGMTPEGDDNVGDAKIIAIYDDAKHEGQYEKYPN